MNRRKTQGVRCANCGCYLDADERWRCDCEKHEAERKAKARQDHTRRIIAHNLRMMEHAQQEFDYA